MKHSKKLVAALSLFAMVGVTFPLGAMQWLLAAGRLARPVVRNVAPGVMEVVGGGTGRVAVRRFSQQAARMSKAGRRPHHQGLAPVQEGVGIKLSDVGGARAAKLLQQDPELFMRRQAQGLLQLAERRGARGAADVAGIREFADACERLATDLGNKAVEIAQAVEEKLAAKQALRKVNRKLEAAAERVAQAEQKVATAEGAGRRAAQAERTARIKQHKLAKKAKKAAKKEYEKRKVAEAALQEESARLENVAQELQASQDTPFSHLLQRARKFLFDAQTAGRFQDMPVVRDVIVNPHEAAQITAAAGAVVVVGGAVAYKKHQAIKAREQAEAELVAQQAAAEEAEAARVAAAQEAAQVVKEATVVESGQKVQAPYWFDPRDLKLLGVLTTGCTLVAGLLAR